MPRYMLLVHRPVAGPPAGVGEADVADWMRYTQTLEEAGVLVHCAPVQGPDVATTVSVREGETQVSDGPILDGPQTLGGYYLIECADLDSALRHAADVPNIHYGSTEVRPIQELEPAAAGAPNAQAHA